MSKAEQAQEKLAAPPTMTRAQEMLLDFLHEPGVAAPDCPVCGYNLKALTRPICPECGQELVLTVGAARVRLAWLLAAVAPGFFSGIAALFVLVPLLGRVVFGDGRWSPTLIALDLFGWCSALFAIFIAAKPRRFIAQPRARQRWWTLSIWLIHIAAFVLFLVVGPRYI